MGALATNLAAAQFAAKSDRLTTKADTLDRQISSASNLKSMLLSLSTSLGDRVRAGDLSPTPQIANSTVAKATLSGTATPTGSYSLEVTALATGQTLASPAYPSATVATDTVGSGTLTLRFGTVGATGFTEDATHTAVDVTIAAGATLADVARAINGKGAGVTAYVASTADGAKLVLKGKDGAANGFILEASETAGDPGLANLAWNPTTVGTGRKLVNATDASFTIDGLPITAKGNSVTNAVPGLNLTLTATNAGNPTQISFGDPTAAVNTAMQDLTAALNEIVGALNNATNSNGGDLARDGGAIALKKAMGALAGKIIMPNAAAGAPRTLADLGLSTQRDGTYLLDAKRLTATLQAAPDATAAMFTTGLYGVYSSIDSLSRNASTTGNPGSLGGSISRYSSQKTQVTKDKTKLVEAQEALRSRLASRFAVSDAQVGASRSTLSFIQSQVDAWNSSNN